MTLQNDEIAQIMELRDAGLTWAEVEQQMGWGAEYMQRCVRYAKRFGFDWQRQRYLYQRLARGGMGPWAKDYARRCVDRAA